MNRRNFISRSAFFATIGALLPQTAFAGKGWCRSDPIVRVDGQMYQITGFANAKQAIFDYIIHYRDEAKLIMSKPQDELSWIRDDAGFLCSVEAFDTHGNVVESYVEIKEIGA